ncbi:carbamoyltransferase HypF [Peribacillus acanthi]|uniref:carbamoyltransferase HypF n=1 Tax=Peribacillus acanthi TaxID=2171554 RepID=UPI000D3EDBCA|nr:carbamoyltransferase HypF [Peribacillus acanthi]
MYTALRITVTGRIQGVGFRPFVYSLAKKHELNGTVQNIVGSVRIVVEGEEENVERMVSELKTSQPSLAKIDEVCIKGVAPKGYEEFTILPSEKSGDTLPWISADAALCKDCLKELMASDNRRYHHPFINCTQCGPRYSIVKGLPYDRPKTTMNKFIMCPDCQKEYENPMDRRHHAQPICCPNCGPDVTLLDKNGVVLAENIEAISVIAQLIQKGNIVGIKGIGGYHLACDAFQEMVIEELRNRKRRPQRPLAIMVKSVETARKYCHISDHESTFLTGTESPIVILQRKIDCPLPINISPGLSTIGMMLPYTPVHHLMFEISNLECLVMTSANPSGLPMLFKEEDFHHLQELCDYVLVHNREIFMPIDDSVVQLDKESPFILRRARGFVPDPMKTTSNVDRIISLGGNQKNTFALGKHNHIMLSPHIGDLDNEEMIFSYEKQLLHFKEWLSVEEDYFAIDKHPLYATTAFAKKLNGQVIPIQHHHAHHVSCMEDNGLSETCLGIILDGTGYGEDGHIWGYEFLYGNAESFERLGHLKYTPLPGGERAVKEPWRNAVGMLLHYFPNEGKEWASRLFPEKLQDITVLEKMVKNQINTPWAGTCGRLFDSISAILGICLTSTYEGEAAIKLSDYLNRDEVEYSEKIYPFHIKEEGDNGLQLDFSPMIQQIIQDRFANQPIAAIIHAFHRTIVSSCVQMIQVLVEKRPDINRTVVLSGGSFQNLFLAIEVQRHLQQQGFNVYTHKNVPCHDGGISYGQIIIASHIIQNKRR